MKPLVVLGATGSIGRQTLDVAARLGIPVVGLAAGRATRALLDLASAYPNAQVAAALDPDEAARFDIGTDAVAALARIPDVTVVNGIVGAAGLEASVAALETGNRLALANKESLIVGGPVVTAALEAGGGELIPVDSEHSALWQCLEGEDRASVARLVLTASGGPFRGRSRESLSQVSIDEALAHPTWQMGPRITLDSATLMNKAFEVIEAHHIFGFGYDEIEVVVHPQSIVHSLVEFVDGSVKAQLGDPDMRHPIQYAITYPLRTTGSVSGFDITKQDLTFEAPDRATFAALDLGYEAGRAGGSAPAVLNAADEIAVAAFLDGRIGFLAIASVVGETLDAVPWRELNSVDDALDVDAEARRVAAGVISRSAL